MSHGHAADVHRNPLPTTRLIAAATTGAATAFLLWAIAHVVIIGWDEVLGVSPSQRWALAVCTVLAVGIGAFVAAVMGRRWHFLLGSPTLILLGALLVREAGDDVAASYLVMLVLSSLVLYMLGVVAGARFERRLSRRRRHRHHHRRPAD